MLCRNGRDRANPWHSDDVSAGFINGSFPAFSHYMACLPIVLRIMVTAQWTCLVDSLFPRSILTDKAYYTLQPWRYWFANTDRVRNC